jgi:hypothetical protein
MSEQAEMQARVTLREIAQSAGTTHTRVRHLITRGLIPYDAPRRGIPSDVGSLIATVITADTASTVTAELMREDPAKVLEGALALAELARRALAEQARQGRTAISETAAAA